MLGISKDIALTACLLMLVSVLNPVSFARAADNQAGSATSKEPPSNRRSSTATNSLDAKLWFAPGQPVPISKQRKYGQLGRGEDYRSSIVGTADVFGAGSYDLFLFPDRLFPFRGFDKTGIPLYGKP
ncbi:MAG: hypothetical protein KDA77_09140, partial [Planctomycetaceae bacterium]|nr:hypothetical protein [Planctomycetaceae bacterium]